MSNRKMPETVVISGPRLENILKTFKDDIRTRHGWPAPAGIFITLFTTLVVSDIKLKWGVSADLWQSLLTIFCVLSLLWLIYEIRKNFKIDEEENLYNEITENLKNSPEFTVIFVIKLTTDNIPRMLVERKVNWECFFLPYVSHSPLKLFSDEKVNELKGTIASYLAIPKDSVKLEHLKDTKLISEKYSKTDNVTKQYTFDFFKFFVPKEKMLKEYTSSPFEIGGRTFYWKTLVELKADVKTMENNGDVLEHLEKHYTSFVSSSDSIH